MIRLSSLIEQFETDLSLLTQYSNRLLPSHKKALSAMKYCRTKHSLLMQAKCADCGHDLTIPHSCGHRNCPQKWIVDCRSVGGGDKTIIYLGRYLYRGVIREKDILSCKNGKVTYRYKNSKTKCFETRTVSGAQFLWLLLKHVLPKGWGHACSCNHMTTNRNINGSQNRLRLPLELKTFKHTGK